MRTFILIGTLIVFATPALAQFPPPGVYACVDASRSSVGELTLFVAGDYSFKDAAGNSGSGQVASAGADVNPLSGPLKQMQLIGVFGTDDTGRTVFKFTGPHNQDIACQ